MRHSTEVCLVWRRSMKISRPIEFVIDKLRGAPAKGGST
jgi:hypothetical protein